jgi:hypothetical protein
LLEELDAATGAVTLIVKKNVAVAVPGDYSEITTSIL